MTTGFFTPLPIRFSSCDSAARDGVYDTPKEWQFGCTQVTHPLIWHRRTLNGGTYVSSIKEYLPGPSTSGGDHAQSIRGIIFVKSSGRALL